MKRNKLFFVAILLLAAMAASGAPTVATDKLIVPAIQMASDTPAVIVPAGEVVGSIDDKLANLGKEFLQPPTSFVVLGDTRGDSNVKPLPAVPAAIFMVLSGFLCVSLVRDHKVWLAALAALLWAGQVGIQALPQLALCFSNRNISQQQFSADLAYPHYLENSNRLRSDIDGTQYIGLLHHLGGMPDAKNRYFHKYTHSHTSQSAIILAQIGLSPLSVCLASRTRQFTPFSPAFIFANHPRSPPIQA